jgi:histidinol-phosphate aminotransferase
MNIEKLNDVNRIFYNFKDKENGSLRMDRNEKVEDWDIEHFNLIFNDIKSYEITGYPPNNFDKLYQKYASYLNISKNNIYITCGADDAIREFFIMYCIGDKKICINTENYGMYNVFSNCLNLDFYEIPYIIDLNYENLCKLDKNKLNKIIPNMDVIFFTNPNQLSNNDISLEEMDNLCKKYSEKIFFIDETYYGFGHFTFISLVKKHKNIFICRSASKTFGLASLRVGSLIAHEDSIKPFISFAPVYKINVFSAKIMEYFLDNLKIVNSYNNKVIEGRSYFVKVLKEKGYKVNSTSCICIFILFENELERNNVVSKLESNKIYVSKRNYNYDSKIYYFIRLTCAPLKYMNKLIKYF